MLEGRCATAALVGIGSSRRDVSQKGSIRITVPHASQSGGTVKGLLCDAGLLPAMEAVLVGLKAGFMQPGIRS